MSLNRSIVAGAVSVSLAIALATGLALSAQAAPVPSPIPAPITPGPSVSPLPPGFELPLFSVPGCASFPMTRAVTATRVRVPGFVSVATPAGVYGSDAATVVSVIRSHTATTCSWGLKSSPLVTMTVTAITPAEYKLLKGWYGTHSTWSGPGGGPTRAGSRLDTYYSVGTIAGGTGPREVAALSPNGWLVTVHDAGIGALPYFQMDVVERFFELNPRLALVSR
jgi:hypothetical protein